MWLRWLTTGAMFLLAIFLASGVFALVSLVLPHPQEVHFLINLLFLLVGIVLGGGTVILLLREQMHLFNQTLRELIQAINETSEHLHLFYKPSINLPQDVSFVIGPRPIRPQNPVYRVLQSEGRDRYFRWKEETGITFHSKPDEASFWSDELYAIRAGLVCSEVFARERLIFIEELESESIGVVTGERGEDENLHPDH